MIYLKKSEVDHRVFTKKFNVKTRLLSDDEIDDAVARFGGMMEEESNTLRKLKAIREKMEALKKKIMEAEGNEEHDTLKGELVQVEA